MRWIYRPAEQLREKTDRAYCLYVVPVMLVAGILLVAYAAWSAK